MPNVGGAYPNDPFKAVIFDKTTAKFANEPEVDHKDSNVCITDRVDLYKGKPQIVVINLKQITTSALKLQ
jgi:hypothetical protein